MLSDSMTWAVMVTNLVLAGLTLALVVACLAGGCAAWRQSLRDHQAPKSLPRHA